MKMNQQFKTLLHLAAFAVVTTSANAAISYVKVTNDADSGISSSNTYTHALDFQSGGNIANINTVAFTSWGGNGDGANFAGSTGIYGNTGAGVVTTTGNLVDLMQGMIYPSSNDNTLKTYNLSGLTPNETYDLRVYNHAWSDGESRLNTLVFDAGGADASTGSINASDATTVGLAGANDSYYINYRYTASSSEIVITTQSSNSAGWHLYGLTNQVAVAVPEPTTTALLGLGGLALILRRRK
jgi:hypothetical protein